MEGPRYPYMTTAKSTNEHGIPIPAGTVVMLHPSMLGFHHEKLSRERLERDYPGFEYPEDSDPPVRGPRIPPMMGPTDGDRIMALEAQIAELKAQLDELQTQHKENDG